MVKSMYTTWQLLRYPVVFGGCLAAYFTAFSFRKTYFKEEIEDVRAKNQQRKEESQPKLALLKAQAQMKKTEKEQQKSTTT